MSRITRTLLAILLVELLLAGIWLYLANMGQAQPGSVTPDFPRTLGSTMGMAMGAFLAFGLLLFFLAAKRDREGS
jgi:hypothetical protein